MAPPPPPYLVEELVVEILLRLTVPAALFRAALACKRWRRLLTDPTFRRRYREFHGTRPLLGFLYTVYESEDGGFPRFVPAVASPFSSPALDRGHWSALDCRHGRVLIHSLSTNDLVVWDPITGVQQRVPLPPFRYACCTGAVLCAADGCDHLDCHDGPFRVVFVGSVTKNKKIWVSVYSSDTGAWGDTSSIVLPISVETWPSLRVGDALYFLFEDAKIILRYDLAARVLAVMDVPEEYKLMECYGTGSIAMMEDGRLGFAGVKDRKLYIWAWQEAGADAIAGWEQCGIIELTTLLPIPDTPLVSLHVVGFVEGTDTIFLSTKAGIYTFKIKSRQVTKVGERAPYYSVVPYNSFYMP